eukprot:SAG31_NODE_14854_length_784_cov_1.109489_2_plen_71_part_01
MQRADGQPLPDTDFKRLARGVYGTTPGRSGPRSAVFVTFERFMSMMQVVQSHSKFSMTHAVTGAHEIIAAA